jgi:XTP/dITP diphosphohydrolase
MTYPAPLVLGTRNRKKRLELEHLLLPKGIAVKTLDDFPEAIEVEETGSTFRDNAKLKAVEQARHLGQWVLGEDSGLSVAALDGAPGVYSARYAGEPSNDERNNQKLLAALAGVPLDRRTAWYTCAICLADPQGHVHIECEGRCYGRIVSEYRGVQGFGYDPLFELPEYHLTFGELGLAVKSIISHRARSLRQFLRALGAMA